MATVCFQLKEIGEQIGKGFRFELIESWTMLDGSRTRVVAFYAKYRVGTEIVMWKVMLAGTSVKRES